MTDFAPFLLRGRDALSLYMRAADRLGEPEPTEQAALNHLLADLISYADAHALLSFEEAETVARGYINLKRAGGEIHLRPSFEPGTPLACGLEFAACTVTTMRELVTCQGCRDAIATELV